MGQPPGPFHVWRPGPPLSECVDFLWTYDGYTPPHAQERLLPTGTMELVFTQDASGAVSSGVAGPRSEFLTLHTTQPFSVIAVHFKPGGGFPFVPTPSSELHNATASLDVVWGRDAMSMTDRLWEAPSPAARFQILEHALGVRMRVARQRHPAVKYALDLFERSKGMRRVDDVVERVGLSSRRFIDRFQSEVGLSPKAFCRIRRFNEVLRRIEPLNDVDWADVALSCGYFDQAHFNHDFRSFAGLSPATYVRQRLTRTHVAVSE